MNFERMIAASELMIEVGEKYPEKFNLNEWQTGCIANSASKLKKTCGTTACFGGWLAISSSWKKAGGKIDIAGVPIFGAESGMEAIADYLDISYGDAMRICAPWLASEFYGKNRGEVTAFDVAEKLIALMNMEIAK